MRPAASPGPLSKNASIGAKNTEWTSTLGLYVAVPEGVEPPTFGLGNRCSILLSYGTVRFSLSERVHFA